MVQAGPPITYSLYLYDAPLPSRSPGGRPGPRTPRTSTGTPRRRRPSRPRRHDSRITHLWEGVGAPGCEAGGSVPGRAITSSRITHLVGVDGRGLARLDVRLVALFPRPRRRGSRITHPRSARAGQRGGGGRLHSGLVRLDVTGKRALGICPGRPKAHLPTRRIDVPGCQWTPPHEGHIQAGQRRTCRHAQRAAHQRPRSQADVAHVFAQRANGHSGAAGRGWCAWI